MAVRPKLMMSVGIAMAGLGLIGAGAGATFTAQVAGSTSIGSGGVGLSLNGETGSDLHLGLDGTNLGSHFTPISKDLVLKNTGTLDLASTYLSVKADGCDGGNGEALAKALHMRLTEVTNQSDVLLYDGTLCAMATSTSGQGFTYPPAHAGVGGQLPHVLGAGTSTHYLLVISPDDAKQGLPTAAQSTRTTVNLVFSGFDY
jgi:Camelysin metallo-endopeptidase